MKLEGRVAIVTGSSRGIGKATALAMAQEGAHVVINYLSNQELAEEAAKEARAVGVQALVVGADVSQSADVERMFSQALETFGRIDILVNNAPAFQKKAPVVELAEEEWDRVITVNLKGQFLCAKAAARQMIQQGSGGAIINISTLGAQVVMHGMAAYCASKGGVETFTRALALELAQYGIRVNGIAPGHINTPMNLEWVAAAPGREERFRARIALGRLGRVEEIASTAVFLASEDSGYITGQTIYAEGGIMIWHGPIL